MSLLGEVINIILQPKEQYRAGGTEYSGAGWVVLPHQV